MTEALTQVLTFADFVSDGGTPPSYSVLMDDAYPADALPTGFVLNVTEPFAGVDQFSAPLTNPRIFIDSETQGNLVQTGTPVDAVIEVAKPLFVADWDVTVGNWVGLHPRVRFYDNLLDGAVPQAGAVTISALYDRPSAAASGGGPSCITVAQLKEHVETDLGTDALQRIIDDACSLVAERAGPQTAVTQRFVDMGLQTLWLARTPALPFTTVTEDGVTLVLDTDFRLLYDGRGMERIDAASGYVRSWGREVVLVYNRQDDTARRVRVTIDLCKLALSYTGHSDESEGDVRQANPDYQRERESILRGLRSSAFTFA